MLALKITPGTAQFDPFHLLVPPHISFYQLHAALELLLHPIPRTYYSFMLMTNRCAIESREAGSFRIVPAFEKNPVIQYRNPCPGEALCTLELESVDTPGESLYPIAKGTEGDGECNAGLQEYCTFTENWSYQNMTYFRKRQGEQQRQAANIRRQSKQGRSLKEKSSHPSAPPTLWRSKNPGERISFLFDLADMYDEVRISVDVSEYGQAELLGQVKKENLLRYCRYAGFRTKSTWRKAQIAECSCRNPQENIWLCLVLLPREALELYLRLCRMKKGRKISVDAEDVDLLRLFLDLGIANMAYPDQKNVLIFELAEDFRQSFLQVFQSTYRFNRDSPASVYLPPEKKTGSWQKLADGYGLLDERVGMLLRYYGILTEEQLCTYLKTCYGYIFTSAEFSRYLMLRLRLLELVYTGVSQELKKRIVCLNGADVEYAYRTQGRFHMPADEWKPVNQKALEENEEILSEWYHLFTALMEPYAGEAQTGFLLHSSWQRWWQAMRDGNIFSLYWKRFWMIWENRRC